MDALPIASGAVHVTASAPSRAVTVLMDGLAGAASSTDSRCTCSPDRASSQILSSSRYARRLLLPRALIAPMGSGMEAQVALRATAFT